MLDVDRKLEKAKRLNDIPRRLEAVYIMSWRLVKTHRAGYPTASKPAALVGVLPSYQCNNSRKPHLLFDLSLIHI